MSSSSSSATVHPTTPFLQEKHDDEDDEIIAVVVVNNDDQNMTTGAPKQQNECSRQHHSGGDVIHVLGGSPFPFNDQDIQHCCCSLDGCEALMTCGLCHVCLDENNKERSQILRDWMFSMCFPELAMGLAILRMDRKKAFGTFCCSLALRAISAQYFGCMLDAGTLQGVAQGVDFACNEEVCQLLAAAGTSCCLSLCASTYTAYDINIWAQEQQQKQDSTTSSSNFCKYCIGLHCFQPCFAYTAIRAARQVKQQQQQNNTCVLKTGAPRQCQM
jgi:hypothetical protein